MQSQQHSKSVIFSCSHISKKFEQIEVLKDVTFTISKSEKIGLVGPNGSGKSTLLKIIAGLLEKDGGTISHATKTKISYLPQVHLEPIDMSGGEIAKKILLPIISSDADLFLLDEPTNNLDTEGLEMIEGFIRRSKKAFLIVSHDRAFLDKTVTKIIEIDLMTKSSFVYDGNYSDYRKEREEKIEREWKEYADKTDRVGKMSLSVDQRVSWTKKIEQKRKNRKNLPIHEREKINAAVYRDQEGRASRRMKVMKNRLERYEKNTDEIQKPKQEIPILMTFVHEHGGTKVFELKDVKKKMGKRNIGPINLSVKYGDRLHITGKNGTGKTTLLKILLGELKADSGILEKGENVKIGYISQERWFVRSNKKVLEEFLDTTQLESTEARAMLYRFGIGKEDVKKSVSLISPGEYSRLIIAELSAQNPNCIILDEPSNHLDLQVLEELENGLKDYTGTLIVVSHDRYFIEKVKLSREFDLDKNSFK